jgi:hypothetical protein
MHPRLQELFEFVDRERELLKAAVQAVPEGDRERKPGPGRWSVAETVEHVAVVERVVAGQVKKMVAEAREKGLARETETGSVMSSLDVNLVTSRDTRVQGPDFVAPRGEMTADQALAALDETHAALKDAMASGDGLALGEISFPHPMFGPLNLYQWMVALGGHDGRHRAQIEETAQALAGEAAPA